MKKRTHIILNPLAGGGKGRQFCKCLIPELEKRFGKDYLIKETSRQGDAIIFAREAVESNAGIIVAAGGDGTVNEVVNGILTAGRSFTNNADLGILNCGSGGGLAQTLRLPDSVSDQLDLICESKSQPFDVGFVIYLDKNKNSCERYFVSECQAGIGGSVVSQVGMKLKHFGGTIAFGLVALSHLVHYKVSEMRLQLDAKTSATKKMIGVTIGNGIYCAGGMQLTPNALTNDGQLDLLGIHEMNLMTRFLNFGKVYSGNHVNSKYFSLTQAKEIYIDSGPSVWIEADGELLGRTPCRIGVVPGAIRVRYI
jgi:diacylglycerol kinase (ATP)